MTALWIALGLLLGLAGLAFGFLLWTLNRAFKDWNWDLW